MATYTLKELLRQNPKAAKHAGTIKGALSDLAKLREAGLTTGTPVVASPYGGKIGKNLKDNYLKERRRSYLKVTFGA